MKIRIVPLFLSAVLMAAHFLRSNSFLPVLICLGFPLLFLIKRRWVLVVMQSLTIGFALVWGVALYAIIQERILEGRSWVASAIILCVVAFFSLFSGWLLNSPQIKNNYPV